MNWNRHSELEGTHASFGASNYHWVNYTEDKFIDAYNNLKAKQRGVELHEFAAQCIRLGQRLPSSNKTLNLYVNDALKYRMTPELVLYYSPNFYGTADAISYHGGMLRIHDLKTGVIPAHIEQLMIYAALFFLEYRVDPNQTCTELRIYQNDECLYHKPEVNEIVPIMDKIIAFDKLISRA